MSERLPERAERFYMLKVTAKAPANIAFIKYWGKKDEKLRIPANSSISMNLSEAYTITSVEFNRKFKTDQLFWNRLKAADDEASRVSKHLDLIRDRAGIRLKARVISQNNFPKGAGIASSASGFAALTVAAAGAAGLNLSERELTILARIGSGSACRSIPDGFVEWQEGRKSDDSYAHSLFKPEYWKICDLIAVVGENNKKVSSTEGHAIAESSPFYGARIAGMKDKVKEIKAALEKKDFTRFGEIVEAEAINMHAVMMTSVPPLFYWNPGTLEVLLVVKELRDKGIEAYFTIDAGPNVHVICQSKDKIRLKKALTKIKEVKSVIANEPAIGARVI